MLDPTLYIGIVMVLVLSAVFVQRWRRKNRSEKTDHLQRLEEVVKASQLTNDGFFRSLDLVQKNLESLLARAEAAEARMRTLTLQPGVERREQYAAAALLLNEGQDAQRVSTMLNLPLQQVQIVADLQQMSGKEKRLLSRRKNVETLAPAEKDHPKKSAGRKEKSAAQPILLVDVLRNAAHEQTANNGRAPQLTSATA